MARLPLDPDLVFGLPYVPPRLPGGERPEGTRNGETFTLTVRREDGTTHVRTLERTDGTLRAAADARWEAVTGNGLGRPWEGDGLDAMLERADLHIEAFGDERASRRAIDEGPGLAAWLEPIDGAAGSGLDDALAIRPAGSPVVLLIPAGDPMLWLHHDDDGAFVQLTVSDRASTLRTLARTELFERRWGHLGDERMAPVEADVAREIARLEARIADTLAHDGGTR